MKIARTLILLLALIAAAGMSAPSFAVVLNDSDSDGCSDGEEVGLDPRRGGQRDPLDFWDVFDTPGAGGLPPRDKAVTVTDIFRVATRFGATGDAQVDPLSPPPPAPAYHPAYDRGGQTGANVWNQAPADGAIAVGDIFAVAAQFGHDCNGPEVVGTWTSGATMPTPRTEVTSSALDGVIYVLGGFLATGANTDAVEAYDTALDSWSTKAPLPQPLDHAGAAAVGGKIYVVGGYISLLQGTISSATYEYDPVGDSWTLRRAMPLARAAAATVALDGVIYVLGGVGPQATVPLAYDPASDTWSLLAPMSAAREHLTASVAGGKIYVIGGRRNVTQNVSTVEVYDPAANSWQTLAPLPTARGGLASGTLSGRVHVVGGEDLAPGGSTFPQHEVYAPVSNSWQPGPPLPTPRHGLAAQVVGDRLYVVGGGPTPRLSVSDVVEIFQLKP